jgi:hypothetical protein
MDHRSVRWFSTGVPVMATAHERGKVFNLQSARCGRVLDRLCLVDDENIPPEIAEQRNVRDGRVVGGEDDVVSAEFFLETGSVRASVETHS